jgi:hypothetical protein
MSIIGKKFTPGPALCVAVDDYEYESIWVPMQVSGIFLELFEKLDKSNWFCEIGEA